MYVWLSRDEPCGFERGEEVVAQDGDIADRRGGDVVLGVSGGLSVFARGEGMTYFCTIYSHSSWRMCLLYSHALVVCVGISEEVAFLLREACACSVCSSVHGWVRMED